MISRPTTAQILDDCARELREVVAPAVSDPTIRVRLEMMEMLLASCAVRASSEITWMIEECAEMDAFTDDVVVQHPESTVAQLHDAYRSQRSDSADLLERIAQYDRAGRAFARAMEHAIAAHDLELTKRARVIVGRRRDRETLTRPNFFLPGRS
jgi:hypothetical protein